MLKALVAPCVLAFLVLGGNLAIASNLGFLRDSPLSKMTPEDLKLMRATLHDALDHGAIGEPKRWENPKTGASGVVTALKSYERDGAACRIVEIFNEAQGFSGRTRYDFCKQPDGSWAAPAPTKH